ncbi:MAG: glycosyltransferase family 39 protein [Acidobacteriota bacterium]|nr:MAG: glycosyltransferase family 39 protein [Acidobacteriota bacterium]
MRFRTDNGQHWLVLALLVGIPLRFVRLDQPQLWLDELLRLVRFSSPTLWGNLSDLRQDVAAAPLDYVIQGIFVDWWGLSEFSARFHAALFGCLAIPVIYWVAKKILSSTESGICALLLAVFPLHVFYSREGANYSLFFLLTLLSFGIFWQARTESRIRDWSWLFLIHAANLYTNYFAVTVLFAQGVIVLSDLFRGGRGKQDGDLPTRWRTVGGFAGSAIGALLLFLPWALWTRESTTADYPSPFSDAGLPLRVFRELSGGSYPLSLLAFILIILGMRSLSRSGSWDTFLQISAWFALPAVLVFSLDAWRGYFFAIRQLLFVTPPLIFASVLGLEWCRDGIPRSRRRIGFSGALILTVLLSLGTLALSDRKEREDWKGLQVFLEKTETEGILLAAPNIERVVLLRSPEWKERLVNLDEVPLRLKGQPRRQVLLIDSDFVTAAQHEQMKTLLRDPSHRVSNEVEGFTVHWMESIDEDSASSRSSLGN